MATVHEPLVVITESSSDNNEVFEERAADTGRAMAPPLTAAGEAALQAFQRRKLSFPLQSAHAHHSHAALLADRSGTAAASAAGGGELSSLARRRFSNVSDVVSRKLSHTIGWLNAPACDIVEQGRALCAHYIRARLRRSGLSTRRCGLQRLRGSPAAVRDVFPELASVGRELERLHPKLFSAVARQASPSPGGVLAGDKSAGLILTAVARELFKNADQVTWAKVVSLFAVAGGLAVDCVRQNHADYMQGLTEAMADVLEEELAPWIASNGGWQGLLNHYKPRTNEAAVSRCVILVGAVSALIFLLLFIIRLCS
ncbi:apoptosis regulator R1-like isoform X1 [Schistocerca serialis cubense]|uniref:apoptosis regulator R1-like isoform X1 n=2 Tax=Schistocerca TaxID=7008 RepID=UPI00214DF877|nr:apoptosis regulator R1-like isoform X1 [Schistocerca serialis cubense]